MPGNVTDAVIQVAPDSTGSKVDNSTLTVGSNTAYRQRTNISSPSRANDHAEVWDTALLTRGDGRRSNPFGGDSFWLRQVTGTTFTSAVFRAICRGDNGRYYAVPHAVSNSIYMLAGVNVAVVTQTVSSGPTNASGAAYRTSDGRVYVVDNNGASSKLRSVVPTAAGGSTAMTAEISLANGYINLVADSVNDWLYSINATAGTVEKMSGATGAMSTATWFTPSFPHGSQVNAYTPHGIEIRYRYENGVKVADALYIICWQNTASAQAPVLIRVPINSDGTPGTAVYWMIGGPGNITFAALAHNTGLNLALVPGQDVLLLLGTGATPAAAVAGVQLRPNGLIAGTVRGVIPSSAAFGVIQPYGAAFADDDTGIATGNAGFGLYTAQRGTRLPDDLGLAAPVQVSDGTNTMPTMDAAARPGYVRATIINVNNTDVSSGANTFDSTSYSSGNTTLPGVFLYAGDPASSAQKWLATATQDAQTNTRQLSIQPYGAISTTQGDRLRTPTTFKTATATASGNTAVWTPTSGKKFRLMKFKVQVTDEADQAVAGSIDIGFQDSSTDLNLTHSVYVPGAAVAAPIGDAFDSGWIDLGNGKLSALANNVLNVNLSATLAHGKVRVIVCGTEE